jgi:hypothetical protein
MPAPLLGGRNSHFVPFDAIQCMVRYIVSIEFFGHPFSELDL